MDTSTVQKRLEATRDELDRSIMVLESDHPLEQLRRTGVRVSVNTDDPVLLGTRLEWEYARIGRAAHWGPAEYLGTARTSIEAAFCTDEVRGRLLAELDAFAEEKGERTP